MRDLDGGHSFHVTIHLFASLLFVLFTHRGQARLMARVCALIRSEPHVPVYRLPTLMTIVFGVRRFSMWDVRGGTDVRLRDIPKDTPRDSGRTAVIRNSLA
jgi:hypothetical protein